MGLPFELWEKLKSERRDGKEVAKGRFSQVDRPVLKQNTYMFWVPLRVSMTANPWITCVSPGVCWIPSLRANGLARELSAMGTNGSEGFLPCHLRHLELFQQNDIIPLNFHSIDNFLICIRALFFIYLAS